MRPSTRRLLELALEITVPIVILAVLWAWTSQSETFYYPPLSDVFERFADNWEALRYAQLFYGSLELIDTRLSKILADATAAPTTQPDTTTPSPCPARRVRRPAPSRKQVWTRRCET